MLRAACGCGGDAGLELLPGLPLQGLQHVVGGVHAARRATDSDAHAQVGVGDELLVQRSQAVVAAVTATALHADLAGGQVDVVVDHDEVRDIDVVELDEPLDRAARDVHERLRLGKSKVAVVETHDSDLR